MSRLSYNSSHRIQISQTGNGILQDFDEKNMFVLTLPHTYVQASAVDKPDGRLFAEIQILCQCQLLMSMSMSVNLCQSSWLIAMMYQCQQTISVTSENYSKKTRIYSFTPNCSSRFMLLKICQCNTDLCSQKSSQGFL